LRRRRWQVFSLEANGHNFDSVPVDVAPDAASHLAMLTDGIRTAALADQRNASIERKGEIPGWRDLLDQISINEPNSSATRRASQTFGEIVRSVVIQEDRSDTAIRIHVVEGGTDDDGHRFVISATNRGDRLWC
jgi:hypothetical protein